MKLWLLIAGLVPYEKQKDIRETVPIFLEMYRHVGWKHIDEQEKQTDQEFSTFYKLIGP